MKIFFCIIIFTCIPIGIALNFNTFLNFLHTILRGASSGVRHGVQHAKGAAARESVKNIGANLAGGAAGGIAVEIASKILKNNSMFMDVCSINYSIIYRCVFNKVSNKGPYS